MPTFRKYRTKGGTVRHQAIIRLSGRRPLYASFNTKTEARRWAQEVESGIRSGRLLPALEAERHTLAEAVGRVEETPYLKWWNERYGKLTLANLTPAEIAEGYQRLASSRSAPTANRYLSALSVLLGKCEREWLWIQSNPCRKIKRGKEHPGRVRFLSEPERDRLLEACRAHTRLYALVVLALHTGARQGELLNLRWRDLDGRRATLHNTKNRERRAIFLTGDSAEVLTALPRHISGFVFANPQGKPTFPRKAWDNAVSAAKLQDFRFHDLRHTAASYLAMSGATLAEIAEILGHKTLAVTKRYAHLTEQHVSSVSERMARKFLR